MTLSGWVKKETETGTLSLILLSSVPIKLITLLAYLFACSTKTRFAAIREITFGLLYGFVYLHVSQKHFGDLSQFNSPRKSNSAVCCCDGSCLSCFWNELRFSKGLSSHSKEYSRQLHFKCQKIFPWWISLQLPQVLLNNRLFYSCLFHKLKVFFYYWLLSKHFSQLKFLHRKSESSQPCGFLTAIFVEVATKCWLMNCLISKWKFWIFNAERRFCCFSHQFISAGD